MEDAIDQLYDLDPADFTAARDALVKQLRAEKRRDEANAVKALRRPTVPAWAVNQVARRRPELVEGLIAAGQSLAAAQRRALSGVKESGMRAGAAQRREAVDQAWAGASAILQEVGIDPAAHRQAVSDTFEAATADAEAAQEVRAGRLSKELPPPSGFGAVTGFSVIADEDATRTAGPVNQPTPTTVDDADSQAAARREAEDAARQARQEAEEGSQRADAAQRRAGDARQAAVRAAAEAERLERRAAEARARADERAEQAAEAEREATAAVEQAQRLAAAADEGEARARR